MSTVKTRTEKDQLGEVVLPENSFHGIHTARALENFHISGMPCHPQLVQAYGQVKQACAMNNLYIGALEKALEKKAEMNLLPLQPGDVPDTYADVDDLVEQFDYKPSTSVDEGVARFIGWYRQYFKL